MYYDLRGFKRSSISTAEKRLFGAWVNGVWMINFYFLS